MMTNDLFSFLSASINGEMHAHNTYIHKCMYVCQEKEKKEKKGNKSVCTQEIPWEHTHIRKSSLSPKTKQKKKKKKKKKKNKKSFNSSLDEICELTKRVYVLITATFLLIFEGFFLSLGKESQMSKQMTKRSPPPPRPSPYELYSDITEIFIRRRQRGLWGNRAAT